MSNKNCCVNAVCTHEELHGTTRTFSVGIRLGPHYREMDFFLKIYLFFKKYTKMVVTYLCQAPSHTDTHTINHVKPIVCVAQ